MSDPIQDAMTDLRDTIVQVPSMEQAVMYVYDGDDVVSYLKDYGFPVAGIIYLGAVGKDSKLGLHAEVSFSLLIIGGNQATDKTDDIKSYTLAILNDIRQVLGCRKFTRENGGGQRKWLFVNEAPAYIDDNLVSYVQTWKTTIVLTNA